MTALTGIAPSACDSAVIPAQAGIQEPPVLQLPWTPAFAGVTVTVETESGNALAGRSPWLAASRWETARRSLPAREHERAGRTGTPVGATRRCEFSQAATGYFSPATL